MLGWIFFFKAYTNWIENYSDIVYRYIEITWYFGGYVYRFSFWWKQASARLKGEGNM